MIVYNAPFFFLETTGTSYIMRLTACFSTFTTERRFRMTTFLIIISPTDGRSIP